MTETPTSKSAWVQLYEARRPTSAITTRSPGRPAASIPRHKVGVTLSQGETTELEIWQERFSNLLGRKVSMGETIGILTRICSVRFNAISSGEPQLKLEEIVDLMIG